MRNASQSSVQAAIAAIIEREKKDGPVPPEFISQANRVWIDRNLSKHLEPVFAEVARKIGLDKNKLDEAVAQHEQEVTQYLKEREPETEKNFAALTKIYRGALANRKAALDAITPIPPITPTTVKPPVKPPYTPLIVLDKPDSIFGEPLDLLVEEHIESCNSWAKIVLSRNHNQALRATFFFSWLNDSHDAVVITGVNSSLTARGEDHSACRPGSYVAGRC